MLRKWYLRSRILECNIKRALGRVLSVEKLPKFGEDGLPEIVFKAFIN